MGSKLIFTATQIPSWCTAFHLNSSPPHALPLLLSCEGMMGTEGAVMRVLAPGSTSIGGSTGGLSVQEIVVPRGFNCWAVC
jgi:hypothetical protein